MNTSSDKIQDESKALKSEVEQLRKQARLADEELEKLRKHIARLDLALDGAEAGFWDHNLQTDKIIRSHKWAEMLGYDPEKIGPDISDWLKLVHPDDIPIVKKTKPAHEAGEIPCFRVEHRMKTKSGDWKWILNWGKVVERDENGQAIRATGIHLDITDKKRMEDELAKSDKLDSIGVLAGGIAHDFNNVLTVILGNVSMVKMRLQSDNYASQKLDAAERAICRAQQLTQQLMTFSEGGAPALEVQSIDRIIRDASEFALRGSNVKCTMDIPCDLYPVRIDEKLLSQVFCNLLLNSDQAMPNGGVVKISVRNTAIIKNNSLLLLPGNYVKIQIEDEGVGIPENHLKKIFDPFFSTKQSGSGLGLAIVYSVIRNHYGSVQIDSKMSVGTTATIHLPAANEPGGQVIPDEKEVKSGAGRILVVEDEEPVRDILEDALDKLGYKARLVSDGSEAVKLFKDGLEGGQPFDAVIMDLTIPGGMGGKQTIDELLKIDPDVKAIVSSGYSNDAILSNYSKYGFCGKLVKPYNIRTLGDLLETILRASEQG
jgi:PAS domain S-box-containing protein